jgi:hypothetical protein
MADRPVTIAQDDAGEGAGLPRSACAGRHGRATPRGQDPVAAEHGGRFGRMFPDLPACELSDEDIDDLVTALKGRPQPNRRISAGYTYLGQFIDHDITFDPLSDLQRRNDPHALVNFRTPRFDLDSLYGSGPADQPYLYDWSDAAQPGVRLLVGRNPRGRKLARSDLPRNEQDRALVGDPRNDENLIVAQLHLLFIRFHNKVVDRVRARADGASTDVLAEAQRIVRWHYQWIVVHDFLRRIVGAAAHDVLLPRVDGSAPARASPLDPRGDEPTMPLEFSAAAYRFGHSMVRNGYRPKRASESFPLFRPHGESGLQWSGSQRLPAALEIEWDLFFFETDKLHPDDKDNDSLRIDPSLAAGLFRLPPDGAQLARLNLRRSRALGLPSGPDVARAMSIEPLTEEDLRGVTTGTLTTALPALVRRLDRLPLWVYVLTEAVVAGNDGLNLGPVGGRIVSDVLVGLLEADPSSYLRREARWTPELSDRDDGDFTMLDLVRYVEDPDWL